ncbi:Ankyrin repeat-containing domain [Pseudocohnilembus persalinus]|uniref:Ankyrin repeat-containing domain n=1 Tax=Pseudocohnilembus persalinus TaxID=266149 RepID=A0A0V0R680_PSEPJ|nr:Ankyrin repeat-containing domain [Pseudocohnilembus persalinus]|eukprot:KRX10001.1 Ankyrin repeat-containing domain [Pseudocohnilembus persalinus]
MNQVYEGNSFINLKDSQQQQNNKSAFKNELKQNKSYSQLSSALFQKFNNNKKSVQFQYNDKNQLKQENSENLNQKNNLQQKRPKTAFELKKDFVQQLFQDQKSAVSSYLKGNKLDNFFIEHNSELSKGPSQVVEFMQREFLRINKEAPQILKKHKPSEKSSEEIKHELLKYKRHQFLKDFINKEQEYFDILEKLQTQGTQNFQKSLRLQQKFNFQNFFEPQSYTDKINEKPIIPEELERMDQYKKEKEQAKFLYFQQQFKEKYKKQLEELKAYEENLQEKQKQKQLNNYFLQIKDSDIKIDNQGSEIQAQNLNDIQEQIQEEKNINMLATRDIKKNSYNFEAFELQKQSQYKEENPQELLKYYFLTNEDLNTQKRVSLINEKMDIHFKNQQYIEAIKQQKSKKVFQKMMSHRQNSSSCSQEQSPKQRQKYFDQNQYNIKDRILNKRTNKDCILQYSNSNKGQFSNQNRSISTSPKKLNKNQCQNFSENVQNLEKLNSLKKQQENVSPGKKRNETENSKDLIVFQNKQKKKQKYCKEFDYEGQHIKQKGENVAVLRIKHKKKIEIKNEPLQSGIQKVKNAIRKLKAVDFILNFELEKQKITQKDINNCIQELDIKRTNINLLKKIDEINYLNQQTKQYKDQFPKQLSVEQQNFFKLIKNQNSDLSLISKVLQLNKNWVNLVDFQNLTPLHWAVKRGNLDLVKILIQFGANPLVLDSADRVPKEIAVKYGFREIFKYLNKLEKLEKKKLKQK